MTTTIARPTRQASRAGWLVPVGLILLTLIPIVAGAARNQYRRGQQQRGKSICRACARTTQPCPRAQSDQ